MFADAASSMEASGPLRCSSIDKRRFSIATNRRSIATNRRSIATNRRSIASKRRSTASKRRSTASKRLFMVCNPAKKTTRIVKIVPTKPPSITQSLRSIVCSGTVTVNQPRTGNTIPFLNGLADIEFRYLVRKKLYWVKRESIRPVGKGLRRAGSRPEAGQVRDRCGTGAGQVPARNRRDPARRLRPAWLR